MSRDEHDDEDRTTVTDSGILLYEYVESEEWGNGKGTELGASEGSWGEPHSRVGGIPECDPFAKRNSPTRNGNGNGNGTVALTNGTGAANSRSIVENNSMYQRQQQQQQRENAGREDDVDRAGICRYAVGVANTAMSCIEICQIRLQHVVPHLASSPRYTLCEDSIGLQAERLAHDVIRYLLKEDMYLISRDPVSRSMRHNVYQMLNKHSILFTSMVNRLNVVPDTAYEAFMGVANELFSQGVVTWARIVCLYAFTGRLALWARDRRMHKLKKNLPSYVSKYVQDEIAHFIKGYGGWEQLCTEYPVAEEVSGAVWRSLLVTGATLGLVATILTVTS